MSARLDDALEICLEALRTGADLESCLALNPEIANELRPNLETAIALGSTAFAVPPDAYHRSRTRVLQRLSKLSEGGNGIGFIKFRPRFALAALVIATMFTLLGGRLITVSAQSLPGDALYSLKRTFEEINLTLAPDTQTRQKLEDRYIQRRTNEVISLLHLQRAERVSFEGVIETQTSQEWQINGIPVVLSLDTRILGPAEIGMAVEITGTTQSDGKVLAHELRIRQFHLIGIVESITPEQWTIEGIPIQINEQTSLDPLIRAKDQVIALLEPEDDGNYTALIVVQLSPASRETLLTPSVKEIETTETASPPIETEELADEIEEDEEVQEEGEEKDRQENGEDEDDEDHEDPEEQEDKDEDDEPDEPEEEEEED